jgi:hypothetical protein
MRHTEDEHQETYLQTATPDAWPRASARSAVARQCRKAVCRSFGSQIFNLMAKNHPRPKPASLHAGLYPRIHRLSADRSGETDKLELVSLPPLWQKAWSKGQRRPTYTVQQHKTVVRYPAHTTTDRSVIRVSINQAPTTPLKKSNCLSKRAQSVVGSPF